jgi:adenylate cyclase
MTQKFKIQFQKVIVITITWMVIGVIIAVYDHYLLHSLMSGGVGEEYGFATNMTINIIAGCTSGLIFGSILVFYVGNRFRSKPYWFTVLLVAVLYIVVFTLIVLCVGLFLLPFLLQNSVNGIASQDIMSAYVQDRGHIKNAIVWGLVVVITQFTLQVNDKFGQGVLWHIIRGRYQRPRTENRIFMMLDLQSSTTIAEKLGNEKYHDLLNDFFTDITNDIIYNRGEIYQYVGDQVVISWKMGVGVADNRCIECYFAMKKTIFQLAEKYKSKYGLVPDFKAGIHYGSVIAGEIGIIKRDITFSGDVMNTTSRIQSMCNELNVKILCSDKLLQLLTFADHFVRISVGDIELKGKENKMALSTVEYLNS